MTTKKKTTKKLSIVKPIDKTLTQVEMLETDILSEQMKCKSFEVLSLQQKQKILQAEIEKALQKAHTEYNALKDAKLRKIADLKVKYEINEDVALSYDPITGEIKDE